jgi:Flp pilus assembly protein TadG
MLRKSVSNKRGAAMMELALLLPWVCFLFIGALDWGFYAYQLISVETATRSAALYESGLSGVDDTSACSVVLNELGTLTNMSGVTCPASSSPLVVTAVKIKGPDNADAAQVTVTYTTPNMIPIPGLLAKQFTIRRIVLMRMG